MNPVTNSGAEMSDDMVKEIIRIIIDKWRGTLPQWEENNLRDNDGLRNAMFCEQNEQIAAKCVFEAYYTPFPVNMTHEMIVAAAKALLRA